MQIINVEVSQSLGFLQTQVLIAVFDQPWNLHTRRGHFSRQSDHLLTIINGFCLQVNPLLAI